MLRFACPSCRQALQVPAAQAGAVVACPNCKTRLRVPAVPASPPAPPPAPPPPPPPAPAEEDLPVLEEVPAEEPRRRRDDAFDRPRRPRPGDDGGNWRRSGPPAYNPSGGGGLRFGLITLGFLFGGCAGFVGQFLMWSGGASPSDAYALARMAHLEP